MLNQPTIDKLCAMRMRGMAEALQQMQKPDIQAGGMLIIRWIVARET